MLPSFLIYLAHDSIQHIVDYLFSLVARYWLATTALAMGMSMRDYIGQCLPFEGPPLGRADRCASASTSVPFTNGCRHSRRQWGLQVVACGCCYRLVTSLLCSQWTLMCHGHEMWKAGIVADGTNLVSFHTLSVQLCFHDMYAFSLNMLPNHYILLIKLVASSHNRRQQLL
jgi:hypothetical protein